MKKKENKKIKGKDKHKNVSDMKTSEIIDELYDWEDEERGDELDEEFKIRYPFNYLEDRLKELQEKVEQLERLRYHDHKDGRVVVGI